MNNWKEIWGKRRIDKSSISKVQEMLNLDGYDSGAGKINEIDWIDYICEIKKKIRINDNKTIFEVGCGSGAFLYPFYLNGNIVGGIDFSEQLIKNAKNNIPNSYFEVCEAIELKTSPKYDFIVSSSVFQYFPSLEYAKEVLIKMLEKSKKGILILDIVDKSYEFQSEQERIKKLGKEEYNKKYSGLKHLHYEKEWFELFAKENNLNIEIFPQQIKNYGNNKFKFNVYMERND
jgi:2-polyprenyl-3-methyl-5-hydroxy-6-metoxy-1,4-benzoquinol methylase